MLYRELTDASPLKTERIPDGIDIVCIRELTGGLYFGKPKETTTLPDGDTQAVDTMVYRFSEIERITATDETNRLCSQADASGKPLDEATAKRIEVAIMQSIKWPADGQFLGDWKQGEAIAQSGRGLTWTDKESDANGGNCYNCHQISKEEISHGTLGPSLYNYGKLRGNAESVLKYTWGKIYNAKATNLCSLMPRAGAMGILTEEQISDLVALLLEGDGWRKSLDGVDIGHADLVDHPPRVGGEVPAIPRRGGVEPTGGVVRPTGGWCLPVAPEWAGRPRSRAGVTGGPGTRLQ